MELKTHSEKETIDFAKKFAKKIKEPCIILLNGDLGAGKTHFVKGLAKGLKCSSSVTSPTFTIMNLYEGGKMPIYHFDMYRLGGEEEAEMLGFEEYFNKGTLNGVSVVEWPNNTKNLVKNYDYAIDIIKLEDENARLIKISERR